MTNETVWLFPGQGSQQPGMGRGLLDACPALEAMVAQAGAAAGMDLLSTLLDGTAEDLAEPMVCQLAMFTVSTALAAVLHDAGSRPAAVAGHSLGEYSALVAAGSLTWADGLHAVVGRASVMADASRERPGAMAAIVGLASEKVADLCVVVDGDVGIANENSQSQCVVAGDVSAVDRVVDAAESAGATVAVRLGVSGAFHTQMMAEAQRRFAPEVAGLALHAPEVTVVSSVTGQPIEDIEAYRQALGHQITEPVLWRTVMQRFIGAGVHRFVELGPGAVLSGLLRDADGPLSVIRPATFEQCQALAEDRAEWLPVRPRKGRAKIPVAVA